MEIKNLSSISNTNFENFDKLKQTSDVNLEAKKFKVEEAEKTQPVSEKEHVNKKESGKYNIDDESGVKTESTVKSFSYDIDTSTFMIIVKDKDGEIQQYPTEDLLKFKQMIKEELKVELTKELGKK